jgi:hypothetical protein
MFAYANYPCCYTTIWKSYTFRSRVKYIISIASFPGPGMAAWGLGMRPYLLPVRSPYKTANANFLSHKILKSNNEVSQSVSAMHELATDIMFVES